MHTPSLSCFSGAAYAPDSVRDSTTNGFHTPSVYTAMHQSIRYMHNIIKGYCQKTTLSSSYSLVRAVRYWKGISTWAAEAKYPTPSKSGAWSVYEGDYRCCCPQEFMNVRGLSSAANMVLTFSSKYSNFMLLKSNFCIKKAYYQFRDKSFKELIKTPVLHLM